MSELKKQEREAARLEKLQQRETERLEKLKKKEAEKAQRQEEKVCEFSFACFLIHSWNCFHLCYRIAI